MQINGGHAELLIIMNDRRRSKIRCREGGPLGSYFIPISSPVPRLIDIFFHTRLSLNSSSVDLRPVPLSRSPSPSSFTPLPFSPFRFVFIKCIVRISIYLFPRNNAPTATGRIIDARPRGRGIRSSRRKKPRALFLTFSLSLSFSFSFSLEVSRLQYKLTIDRRLTFRDAISIRCLSLHAGSTLLTCLSQIVKRQASKCPMQVSK